MQLPTCQIPNDHTCTHTLRPGSCYSEVVTRKLRLGTDSSYRHRPRKFKSRRRVNINLLIRLSVRRHTRRVMRDQTCHEHLHVFSLFLCFLQATGSGPNNSVLLPSTRTPHQPTPSRIAGQTPGVAHSTKSPKAHVNTSVVSLASTTCHTSSPDQMQQASTHFTVAELVVAILVSSLAAGLVTGIVAVLLTNCYWRRKEKKEVAPAARRTYSYSPNRMSYLSAAGKPVSDHTNTDFVANCSKDNNPAVRTARYDSNNAGGSSSASSVNEVHAPGIYDSVVSGFEFD